MQRIDDGGDEIDEEVSEDEPEDAEIEEEQVVDEASEAERESDDNEGDSVNGDEPADDDPAIDDSEEASAPPSGIEGNAVVRTFSRRTRVIEDDEGDVDPSVDDGRVSDEPRDSTNDPAESSSESIVKHAAKPPKLKNAMFRMQLLEEERRSTMERVRS